MILDKINSPADLRTIPEEDLTPLAAEVREEIIDVVSRVGGHLAPSLGVVDLTIALHYAFDTPRDRIVWDVGHQAYAHKLLTGRRKQFPTLRQYGGVSGFPKRQESPYDHFDVGHASTSISAALGMVAARDIKKQDYRVIAVIGDGSISAGLAFEGLNQAGHLKKGLVVILNDNEMSISPNVGALSSYLSRLMTKQFYTKLRQETKNFLQGIPKVGESMFHLAKRAEESLKGLVAPGMLFEDLGFQYVGPIDGHRIDHLLETFNNIKDYTWPVLVHVVTKKGKGCEYAECSPSQYHGTPPFDRATGVSGKKAPVLSYTDVFGRTMVKLAEENKAIIAISAAMSEGTGLDKFAEIYPERFYDVGIAESHGVTFACGLAVEGMHPVAAIYSTFMQRAYDQVVHDLCLQNLPVTLALDRAGLVGEDGPTHHGVFDLAYLRHLPNMVIMAPKDENELQHMIKTAVEHSGPTAVRYPRGSGFGVAMDQQPKPLEIGKAEVIRDGNDVVLLALGTMVQPSLDAADRLQAEGISTMVVNARFAKPLDEELILAAAKKMGRVVTAEEHALHGGFGSAVLECLSSARLSGVKTLRIGLPDRFIEHGAQKILRQKYGLDADGIVASVKDFVEKTRLKVVAPAVNIRAMDV
ncbi:MAG TPA: 1-deoxy-D-xylulose-5-phosphate synthase [Nitrospiraceae bacterium]|nr:1-deoxy-D-xylulose-5-phosphate synthase [Nitrospiraceae bacterium]